MVARVSPDDLVIYANSALAGYLRVSKRALIGSPLEVVSKRCRGEIATCFMRPETGRASNHLVTDDDGRVFEAKIYSEGGVLDIVLDEVTTAEAIGRELRESTGTDFASLNEDELRTARNPERRYLTVTYSHLRGITSLTERLAPMEVRLMINSFVEESSDAVLETGCTVGETYGDSVLGIFGAPRYFLDHPFRAIRAACDQMQKTAQLHAGFYREGKELPPSSCGIWTGDVFVGTLGNANWQHYTAIGAPVDLAFKLSQLARPGEVLIPEHTLTHLLRVLPEGWEHVRAESEYEPDLSDFQWTGDDIVPVAEHLRKVVYLIGPAVRENTDRVEYYFDYMWSLRIPGRDQVMPILRVVRPTMVGDSVELRDDNVVAAQAVQTLGKYKLIEVIGTGGMGRVWRGVDRFGNAVAIKVLHSGDTVSDAQIRRFRREAEIMGRLPHRNICRVFEMNEFEGIQYIAMEYVDGVPLSDLLYEKTSGETSGRTRNAGDLRSLIHSLRSEKSLREQAEQAAAEAGEEQKPRPAETRILPVEQTLSILLKVCEAVQFAHEHGVLHRDLKPGNILLRVDGEPLVADFGLAKLNSSDATQSISVSGHVLGTLENMSPEQAESSKDVDERADVYSLGTILYQMITGRRHFEATGNIVTDAQALKNHEPIRPRSLNPQISSDLEIITLKALRSDPVERYRSAAALQADLERYRRGEIISARPVSPAEVFKKMIIRNKGVSAAVAISLIVLVGTTIFFLWQLNQRLDAEKAASRRAEELLSKMMERQREAQQARKEADENRLLAKQAQEAAQEKQNDLEKKSQEAAAAAEEAKKLAEEAAEKDAKQKVTEERLRKRLSETQKQMKELQEATPADSGATKPLRQGPAPWEMRQAQMSLDEAAQIFNLELAQPELDRLSHNPDEIVRKLSKALDQVDQSLLVAPDFVPAWMLKGNLHLALMEFTAAQSCFEQAAKLSNVPGRQKDDHPAQFAQMVASVLKEPSDRLNKMVTLLQASPEGPASQSGRILQVVSEKPGLRHSLPDPLNPLGRTFSASEAALQVLLKCDPGARIFTRPAAGEGSEFIIWNTENVPDLSPLKLVETTALAIIGAANIDWNDILALPLESLDLSKCKITSLPPTQRGFLRIEKLKLAGTDIENIDFVRSMPALEDLNIRNTNVSDLSPLVYCRSLKRLVIDGLNGNGLRSLLNVPLEELTLSPMLILDKTGLDSLRPHRILRVIRAPGDPAGQPAAEFWRKLDDGDYQEAP